MKSNDIKVPQEHPLPPGPNIFQFAYNALIKRLELTDILDDAHRRYGSMIFFKANGVNTYSTMDPHHIDLILGKRADNYPRYTETFTPPIFKFLVHESGRGLVSTEGQTWKAQRQALNPFFFGSKTNHFSAVKASVQDMMQTLHIWRKKSAVIDLARLFLFFATSVMLKLIFSRKMNDEYIPFYHLINLANRDSERRNKGITHSYHFPTLWNLRFSRAKRIAKRHLREIYEDRLKGPDDNHDIFSALRKLNTNANNKIQKDELSDQVLNLMLAGTSTTASLLTWLVYELTLHEEIMLKLNAEYDQINIETISSEELSKLNYSNMVIKEGLRHHAPVYASGHAVKESDVIDGFRIKKNSQIMAYHHGVHHNPKFWTKPEQFIPERFETKNSANRHPLAFQPFGHGPHSCIGINLALLEVRLALPALLKKFHVRLVPEGKFKKKVGIIQRLKSLPVLLSPKS